MAFDSGSSGVALDAAEPMAHDASRQLASADPAALDTSGTPDAATHVILRVVDHAVDAVLVLALLGQLGLLFINVLTRTFTGFSLLWTQELAQLALTVLAFIGGAVAYPRGQHTSVEAGVLLLPPGLRPIVAAVVDWLVFAFGLGGVLLSLPTLERHRFETSPLLKVSVFWYALPLTVGMALLVFYAVRRLATQPRGTALQAGAGVLVVGALLWFSQDLWLPYVPDAALLWIALGMMAVLLLLGVPIGFVLGLVSVAYLYMGGSTSPIAVPLGMETGANSFVLLAVPFFILAGYLMNEGGLTRPLTEFVQAFIGHLRGGLLHVLVSTMYVFSGISGSKVADVAAVGTTMRDMLTRRGYDRGEITAVLASSAIMGETVPPSIPMLVLGSITTLSTGALFMAGLVPAAVMALCLMALVWWRARDARVQPLPKATWSGRGRATLRAIPGLVLPIGLVGGILFGIATPTEVSTFAVVYALLLAVVLYRTFTFASFWSTLRATSTMAGMVLFIISVSTPFAWTLTLAGVPQDIAAAIGALGGSSLLFMLATVITLIVMGQLLEGLPALLVFAPLLVPLAPQFGIDPLQYGIVLIFAMGLGSFAPPIGVGFYVSCAVGQSTVGRSLRFMVPYLIVLLLGLLLVAFVPWFSLVLPRIAHMG